eukprot:Skav210635  [mRNA]  locus=scaffold1063:152705:153708:- [translate_table: standard]
MGVAKRSFSPGVMKAGYEKDFSDEESSSSLFETERSIFEDEESPDSEVLKLLPGQIDIRSYMLPTKPVIDFEADEEAARDLGLDFGLENMEDWEDLEMVVDRVDGVDSLMESFSADEEAAVAMGLSTTPDAPLSPPTRAADPPVDLPADTPDRPKRKAQTLLADTPEKKVRVNIVNVSIVDEKGGKVEKLEKINRDSKINTLSDAKVYLGMERPAELGEVL